MNHNFLVTGGEMTCASTAYELTAHASLLVLEAKAHPDVARRAGQQLCLK
jgi:hypothetical protein